MCIRDREITYEITNKQTNLAASSSYLMPDSCLSGRHGLEILGPPDLGLGRLVSTGLCSTGLGNLK